MKKTALLTLALVASAAGALGAQQMPGTAAKKAAKNVAAAASARANATDDQAPATSAAPVKPQGAPQGAAAQPKSASKAKPSAKGAAKKSDAAATVAAAKPAPKDTVVPRVIMREAFDYEKGGRRDPFASLMMSSDLRPAISDLRLTGILYDLSGRRPVAIMRDLVTKAQYRVTTGMALGRMRVAQIKPKVVVFSIEEFGLNRRDSLMLGDSTKVRTQ